MDKGPPDSEPRYEAPELRVLGTVAGLTQVVHKLHGQSDGLAFGIPPVTTTSP
jgi:hypothetical protein